MGHAVVIRPARAGDESRLALVGAATFLETFAGQVAGDALLAHCGAQHTGEAYHASLASGARAWLAELDGAPIGYALLSKPELAVARTGDLELKRIYLLSRFHGGGAGKRLLDVVLLAAEESSRLLLGVKADNHRAIAFYGKHGFRQIATRRFDVGGTMYDDMVLARPMQERTD